MNDVCGIFTAFRHGADELHASELTNAIQCTAHRGPDHIGHADDGVCFLGHSRLAIVGLERESNQPFSFGDLSIVYNGEVFNYVELRAELSREGYTFDTTSDTEVVLKAYHRWGNGCFEKFNGMWALAIYDRAARRIIASRDRFGQKPMFILRARGAVFFASEVHQLVPFSAGRPDFATIQAFLKEGTYDERGATFFESIEEFPKAHTCVVERDGALRTERYWDYWAGEIRPTTDEDLATFDALLDDAVKLRLRADVPLGVLLSGGVDSTLIAAAVRRHAPDMDLPAFTYSSADSDDEARYAAIVAQRLRLKHWVRHQAQVPEEYRARLRNLVHHMGRGHSSPAIVSVDSLYEAVAEQGLRIALDGQGSDELLAGYPNYHAELILSLVAKGRFRQAVKTARDLRNAGAQSFVFWLRHVLPSSLRWIGRLAYGYERFFTARPTRAAPRVLPPPARSVRNRDRLNRYLIRQHSLGLENLLYYGDIAAMNHSVENRSPFMDHRLVDFVLSRDERLKVWDGTNKFALKRSRDYERFRDVLDREKIGFSSAIKPATKAMMIEELERSDILAMPIFTARLRAFIAAGGLAEPKYERFLFRLYQLHLWHEVYFPSGAEPARPARMLRAVAQ